ncbi:MULTISPECIES: VOC family protein [unclassified Nonomuraea]|uniref:VOC family protein n=1 Tax=Nonomuraea sp. NPDC003804 TaxID=3154547 RepID=UPI0033A1FC26
MVSIGQVVLGVTEMPRAVRFWTQALHYIPRAGAVTDRWTILDPVNGLGVPVALGLSSSPVEPVPRIHLDLFAETTQEQQQEIERLVALGAERVQWDHYPDDADFVVLADPEGNRFCVIDLSHG